MQIEEIRKQFGARLKRLRKQSKWTQKELASMVGSSFSQLNKYEGGFNIPAADKLIRLAQALDTTVDYLLLGNRQEVAPVNNTRLLKRFRELERFDTADQEAIIRILDAMILKNKMKGVMAPLDD